MRRAASAVVVPSPLELGDAVDVGLALLLELPDAPHQLVPVLLELLAVFVAGLGLPALLVEELLETLDVHLEAGNLALLADPGGIVRGGGHVLAGANHELFLALERGLELDLELLHLPLELDVLPLDLNRGRAGLLVVQDDPVFAGELELGVGGRHGLRGGPFVDGAVALVEELGEE